MADPNARRALRAVFAERERNLLALVAAALALWVARTAGSLSVRYAAYLVLFTVWMAWFVLAAVTWLHYADF